MNRMDSKTLKITTGAMIVAIFAILLLLNRQTAGFFEELFVYLLPIPMVAYSAKYGGKSGIPVFVAMALFSFLFGTLLTVFYAISGALLGLIFGTCIYHKIDSAKTLVIVMLLSAVFNVLSTVALAGVFGYDLTAEIREMQNQMSLISEKAGTAVPEMMLSLDFMKRMFIMSMVFFGMVQGFLIYEISLLILRRLRFPVQPPRSVFLYYPPKWSGTLTLFLFFVYDFTFLNPAMDENLRNVFQIVGICGYMYLVVFGMLALILAIRIWVTRNPILTGLLSMLALFILPQALMLLGVMYISFSLHRQLLEALERKNRNGRKPQEN